MRDDRRHIILRIDDGIPDHLALYYALRMICLGKKYGQEKNMYSRVTKWEGQNIAVHTQTSRNKGSLRIVVKLLQRPARAKKVKPNETDEQQED